MSITPPTGILDITNATVRVSKLEFRGSTGFDTILNNVARNTVLLVDQNVEYTSSNSWALKLPNAWVAEFDAYWASGASGNIDFNVYNNLTSGTNGYTISMDDTTITVAYDGGSALATATLGSTLKNDTWRKIHVLFERDMISVALDGVPVLYFKDTLLRPRVYDENSGYVVVSGLSADRKFKNIRVVNGDKWITDGTSNIAYVHGNVGIGTKTPEYTLDVKGDVRATGNLLIEGLTTTVDTQNLSIEDAIVEIGRGNDGGTSGKDVGFLFTRNNGSDTTNSNVALIYDESTDRLTFGYSDGGPTASTLAINTSKSLDVVIPSGKLGVGTASPRGKLDIEDGVLVVKKTPETNTNLLLPDGDGTGTFTNQHTFGNAHIGVAQFVAEQPEDLPTISIINKDRSDSTTKNASIGFFNTDAVGTGKYAARIACYPDDQNAVNNNLRIYTKSGGGSGAGYTYPELTATFSSSGNVGIGTNDPQEKLHLYGSPMIQHETIYTVDGIEGWYKIGTWDANGTSGARLKISLLGAEGFGATQKEKGGETIIYASINNNMPTSVSNMSGSIHAYGNPVITQAKFQQVGTDRTKYDIIVYVESYTQHSMSIECTQTTSFTRAWTSASDPGADSATVQAALFTHVIDNSGNVGIGTTTPYATLHVHGASGAIGTGEAIYAKYDDHDVRRFILDYTTSWGSMSIYANSDIATGGYLLSHGGTIGASDERIKKNIVDADDAECLEVLRLLKPKKYEYKDVVKRGEEPVWGFIAQEVANVLPHATQLRQDFLPNIYELANVSSSNVITFTNFNTSNLEANATTIRVMTKEDKEERATIAEVIDEHTIRVEEDLSAWTGSVDETGNVVAGNQLFIYGQEVDDFVFLKKDAIWTVTTSALQEVDRQLQAEKAKTATLETQVASVLARLDALENA